MANKMVATIKSLSQGVVGLTKELEGLYSTLEKINGVANSSLKSASAVVNTVGGSAGLTKATTRPGTGTDGARFPDKPGPTGMAPATGGAPVSQSKADFSWKESQTDPNVARLQQLGGAAQMLLAPVAGAYAAAPDLSLTMGRALGYYQAGLKSPGISRNQLERATFSAMGGGLSSVGSDAIVAASLAGQGYSPGSVNYKQAASQVGGAYKYLGMENAVASQAIGGLQSGSMAANLFQYGISTTGAGGKEKTPGEIAKELMNYMTGGKKVSVEEVRSSYQKGALGANLSSMGFDPAQQEIMYQAMIDLAAGRNPDLATRGNEQGTDKNSNTMLTAAGRMNASQTSLMTTGEESMIKGFEHAADTVETFNRVLDKTIKPLMEFKGYISGVGGTNVGAGIAVTASMFAGGITKIVDAVLSLGMKGGGAVGYGGAFGVGGAVGSTSIAKGITAGYGDKGSIWSGTNGTHQGTDYAVPEGTPVTAWKDGVVSSEILDSGYGTAVMLTHDDGFQSIYAHLSAKEVNIGETIKKGQRIGKSGSTGNTTGPHLHFELRHGKNNPVDSTAYTSGSSLIGGQYITPEYAGPSLEDLTRPKTSNLQTTSSTKNTNKTMSISEPTSKDALSNAALRNVLASAGFTGESLETALKVVRAESGGRPGALNPNEKTGDYSLGLFQVNMIGDLGKRRNANYLRDYSNIGYTGPESLYDPAINARIAYDISKGGTTWNKAWVNTSRKLGLNGGGDVGYGASITSVPSSSQTSVSPSISSSALSSGQKTVNVTLKIERATEEEAMRFAKLVKNYLDNDAEISQIGRS